MLDKDLAELYGVPTKVLNQAVKRNIERFPEDFMFLLTEQEILLISKFAIISGAKAQHSRSQIVTLKRGKNIKYPPRAFTEHGVAMLSSVLKSKQAIQINILIMRVFTRLKNFLATHKELARKVDELEDRIDRHDTRIMSIIAQIKGLMEPKTQEPIAEKPRSKMGFLSERDAEMPD
jgi:cell division protein FtsB